MLELVRGLSGLVGLLLLLNHCVGVLGLRQGFYVAFGLGALWLSSLPLLGRGLSILVLAQVLTLRLSSL